MENTGAAYYVSQGPKLLQGLDKYTKYWDRALATRLGQRDSRQAIARAREEFSRLIPQIPYIGGKKDPAYTGILIFAAQHLALYRVLRPQGLDLEQISDIFIEAFESQMFAFPKMVRRMAPVFLFSPACRYFLKKQARESQKKKFAGNWVHEFVPGDKKSFDYGIDYTQCALCDFYRTQGALELMPVMCQTDFIVSAALGWGLERTTTLAAGDEKCDFRFKKGRPEKWLRDIRRKKAGAFPASSNKGL